MNPYNKNISALIIITCIVCIIIGIFLPKDKVQPKVIQTKYEKDSYFQINPINVHSPFKNERISVIKLDGIISDSSGTSIFKDITSKG